MISQSAVKHVQADQERNDQSVPSLEVEEAEQAIYNHELTDMTDVMQEMLQELKQQNR